MPGRLTLVRGIEEKAQKIRSVLEGVIRGEWFLNVNEGMPMYEHILAQKSPDIELIRRIYRRAILSVEGIVDVPELSLTLDADRRLSGSFLAIDDEGQEISGGIGVPFVFEEEVL